MNFRNKYLANTIRILFGLMLALTGAMGLFMPLPAEASAQFPQAALDATNSLVDMGLWQFIKGTELIIGLMILFNFLPAVGAVITAPIGLGIIAWCYALGLPLVAGIIFSALNGYLGYLYWDKYKPMFSNSSRKQIKLK